jgi:UV excision repair protein RAD23
LISLQLAQQQQQQQQPGYGASGPGGLAGAGIGPNPGALRGGGDARVHGIRELLTQNPALIQPMIQQLSQENPQLAQLLAENPAGLLSMLGPGMEGGEEGENMPQVINVTPEERAAIERVRRFFFLFA